jgi:16S rRNA processing protein RimM
MRVVVGRIGRPHGIRGEVTVETRTDEPEERFAPGAVLSVDGPVPAASSAGTLVVERTHWHSGRLLVTFRGIEDRTGAEGLRGLLLHVERAEDETPDDDDEYYDSTLEGCDVVLADGSRVGAVHEILHLPSQDLLLVRTDDERVVMIPFVAAIVPSVDVAARLIVVNPPAGLLDPEE